MADQSAPTAADLAAKLRPTERQAAEAYIANGLNARAAARALGKPTDSNLRLVINRPAVREYVQALLTESGMTPAEIRARLEGMARGSFEDFISVAPTARTYWVSRDDHPGLADAAAKAKRTPGDYDLAELSAMFGADHVAANAQGDLMLLVRQADAELVIDWRKAEQAGAIGRLKKVKLNKDGSVEFEAHDTSKPLELLAKASGLLSDSVTVTGQVGLKIIAGLSEDDL